MIRAVFQIKTHAQSAHLSLFHSAARSRLMEHPYRTWSEAESASLRKIVANYPAGKIPWTVVASKLNCGKDARQCMSRWYARLSLPDIVSPLLTKTSDRYTGICTVHAQASLPTFHTG